MPERTKKLLIALFLSIIILILSIIFQPLAPDEDQSFDPEFDIENQEDSLDELPEI